MRAKCGTAALPLSVFYTGTARLKKAPPVCPEDELIRVVILLKMWETTLNKELEPYFGPRVFSWERRRKGLHEHFQ